MRQRFKINRICSSDNYELSKKTHQKELKDNHNKLQSMIIKEKITIKRTAYIKVFGKFIPLESSEIPLYENKTEIIYK